MHETSILSQYQAIPRMGHKKQLLRIFGYMRKKDRLSLFMNPALPKADYSQFISSQEEFKKFYRDAEEPMPHRMPKPRGLPVWITAFVDASHAANKVTRRSHTGFILFVNSAPIIWYSKRQNTVEASTFSSEFIALKTCVEAISALRFKLRMFGVPLGGSDITKTDDAAYVYCDNETVVKNSTLVESTLNCWYDFFILD